ncbi:MAG: cryptochrome/photolyase family protein [Desulfomonilia bacterium]|nr:cryptochrome/photolyase family protein [Desulfomonilia bacterium]
MQTGDKKCRNLVVVFRDQLDHDSRAWCGFDRENDAVLMAETDEDFRVVWAHKRRIIFLLSAMRHYRESLRVKGFRVVYHELSQDPSLERGLAFTEVFRSFVAELKPEKIVTVLPGEWGVHERLKTLSRDLDLPLEVRPDDHFLISPEEFLELATGKKHYLMENFYRTMRKQLGVLLTPDGKPTGGRWNFDHENRLSFGLGGPACISPPKGFEPDTITKEVMDLVEARFTDHPGRIAGFDLPVTSQQAHEQLDDFIEHRLASFGTYEDAMWNREPFLFHSRLSSVLNLKLLSARACIRKSVEAFQEGTVPLNSVEAFTRQIIGWREFIRGIYWMHMPAYATMNHLGHELPVPEFFWNGETDMACLRHALTNVVEHAYTHHIERLMVIGLYALLLGVSPLKFHQWHLAMYTDAHDWVSLPNTLGMSQFADAGIVGTKPYCASGNYINRMGNFCNPCRYDPKRATGRLACPFTTLYWDFLDRHHERLVSIPRLAFQMRNLERKRTEKAELAEIRKQADTLRDDAP